MDEIKEILASVYRDEITDEEAQAKLAELGPETLGEFIVDAFNRDWISCFNLGIDNDGQVI